MINPYKNRDTSTRAIATAESAMRYTATVTTSIGAFIWARSMALDYLPEGWGGSQFISVIVGAMCAALMAWLTDMMFGDLLQRVVYDALAGRHPNVTKWQGPDYFRRLRRAESIGIGIILALLLAFDGYTTLIIRDPVADQARQQELIDPAKVTASVSAAGKQASSPMASRIAELESRIRSAEKAANDNNPALRSLASDGNQWAANELAKKRQRATAADRKSLEALNATYTTALASQATSIARADSLTAARNAAAISANTRNRNVMAGMYTAFTVLPKVLSIILRVLMVISFLAYSHNFNPDLTGDGIIDYLDVEEYYNHRQQERQQRVQNMRQQHNTAANHQQPGASFQQPHRTPQAGQGGTQM